MMKKLTFALLCLMMSIGMASAQTKQVTGTVTSAEDGEPIIGASVIVKGTTTGTVTDFDGKFELTVPSSAKTLEISYVGMTTKEEAIKPTMKIVLETSALNLDEVMVVAYGTAKKSSFTGSAAVVKSEDLAKIQTSDITKALEGQVAGVQLTNSNGQPGEGSKIRIRGIGSINASSDPLIVVDGVPYDGDLNSINQQDVESMTVLKDAASNALYGARGANGVVLITTKKGKNGKARVSFDMKLGANSRAIPEYDIMTSPVTYYETYWTALKNQAVSLGNENPGQYASNNLIKKLGYNITNVGNTEVIDPTTGKFNPNAKIMYKDDWAKELFQSSLRQEYNLNISGASDKTSYYISLGYLDDKGYIVNSDFSRFSTRLRLEQQVNDWFKVGGNLAYAQAEQNSPDFDATSGVNMFYASRVIAPIYPIYGYDNEGNRLYEESGRPVYDYGTGTNKRPILSMSNPLGTQNLDQNKFKNENFSGNLFAEISFLKDFKLTVRGGMENYSKRQLVYQNGQYGQFVAQNGISTIQNEKTQSLNMLETLTWEHSFGLHSFNVLLGHENYQRKYEYLWGSKNNFIFPSSSELDQAISNPNTGSGTTEYNTEGYLGRIEYNYNDKYYFSASYRRDASSKFHPDNRWGNFWSLGASWRLNQENFLKDVEWIDNLKYKISYGSQGNDGLLFNGEEILYPYMDQFQVVNSAGKIAVVRNYKGNKDIKWETNYNFNTGFEFMLFQGRLNGGIDVFTRTAKDLLFYRPLPFSTGNKSYPDNIGDMRNIGFEIELSGTVMEKDNFKWTMGVNATHYKNKILSLPPERKETGIVSGNFRMMEGGSIYDYYLKEYAGVDPQDGSAMWYKDVTDANGNVTGKTTTKVYSDATDYNLGSALPAIYGGFNTAVQFHGIDLSVNLSYQIGGKGYDRIYANLMSSGSEGQNWHNDILKAWTPENTNTNVPRVQNAEQYANTYSSRFFTNASYLNLQNITLGYTLPKTWINVLQLESVRFYFVADNVALLSKRKGFDPRQNWSGESDYNYAAIRTISGGLQVRF